MSLRVTGLMLLLGGYFLAEAESLEPQPRPEIQFIRFTRIGGIPHAEFRLLNDSAEAIYYPGFSEKSPIYMIERPLGTEWIEVGPVWCTIGSSMQALPHSNSVYFLVSLSGMKSPIRLRLSVFGADRQKAVFVRSPVIKIPPKFATPPDEDGPVVIYADIRPPTVIQRIEPKYPEIAQRAHIEGTVVLEIVVDRRGGVRDVRLLRSVPVLDQAAVEAVRQWKYSPARDHTGRPVSVYFQVHVKFEIPQPATAAG